MDLWSRFRVNAAALARTSGSPCTYTNQIDSVIRIFIRVNKRVYTDCTLLLVCILVSKIFLNECDKLGLSIRVFLSIRLSRASSRVTLFSFSDLRTMRRVIDIIEATVLLARSIR